MERRSPGLNSMDQARDMLIGAVDRIIQLASSSNQRPSLQPSLHPRQCSASQNQPTPTSNQSEVSLASSSQCHRGSEQMIDEHKRLFHRNRYPRFEPPKGEARRKGKGRFAVPNKGRRSGRNVWKKATICLRDKDQDCKPSAEEKMELAKLGLGLAELVFDFNGDAEHIHSVLLDQFPQLEACGGYKLMRLKDNSYDLVEIEYPAKGLNVSYLKDILNQAKLYVRPLQRSIAEEISHKDDVASNEPHEFCLSCDTLLPMSQLSKHIIACQQNEAIDRDSTVELDAGPSRKRVCVGQSNDLCSSVSHQSQLQPVAESCSGDLMKSVDQGMSFHKESTVSSESESDLEWERDIQAILHDSISQNSLGNVIRKHKNDIFRTDDVYRITVRRSHVFEDALKAFHAGSTSQWEEKPLKVVFSGEPAIDYGGPTREFFTILMKSIASNVTILDGAENRRVLRHNTTAFQENVFLAVGRMIALSILNGGPGPSFLSPAVVDFLFGGIPMVKAQVEDVPDMLIREKINQLVSCESAAEYKCLLDTPEFEFRFTSGVGEPAASMAFSDRRKVIDAICLHYTILSTLTELEQLKEGLAIQKFNTLMMKFPDIIRTAFTEPISAITCSVIEELYSDHVIIAPSGSDKWNQQQAILNAWKHYLRGIENQDDASRPSLEDIFVFLTGSKNIPPSGFDVQPSIYFDDNQKGMPIVSTCALSITFPTSFPVEQYQFDHNIDLAVLSAKESFGLI